MTTAGKTIMQETKMPIALPIGFSLYWGYRRFSWKWWTNLFWYITQGFWRDIYYFYHRGRYGWCPRDTWSFDAYLDKVIGEGLYHLAKHSHGAPCGYPDPENASLDENGGPVTDCEKWEADLYRWSQAFRDVARDDYYEIHGRNYDAWNADEQERHARRNAALQEMIPWWSCLWDIDPLP
jgi:hypothetical protein